LISWGTRFHWYSRHAETEQVVYPEFWSFFGVLSLLWALPPATLPPVNLTIDPKKENAK
jgi:hypothetical protein